MAKFRRKKLLIDRTVQLKFFLAVLILLVVQTLVVVAAIFAPQVVPLYLNVSIEQKTEAARALILLNNTIWPGVILSTCLLSGLTIYFTHKVSGPIYRVKKSLTEITGGDLSVRIRLRKGDELHDLADQVNLLAEELTLFLNALKESYALQSEQIAEFEREIEAKQITEEAGKELIMKIQVSRKHIEELLDKFSSK
jgi:signal transduction histidine kinase